MSEEWTPEVNDDVTFFTTIEGYKGGIIRSIEGVIFSIEVAPGKLIKALRQWCARGLGTVVAGTTPEAATVLRIEPGPTAVPVEPGDRRLFRITQEGHKQAGMTARLQATANGKLIGRLEPGPGWAEPVEPAGAEFLESRWAEHQVDVDAALTFMLLEVNERKPA